MNIFNWSQRVLCPGEKPFLAKNFNQGLTMLLNTTIKADYLYLSQKELIKKLDLAQEKLALNCKDQWENAVSLSVFLLLTMGLKLFNTTGKNLIIEGVFDFKLQGIKKFLQICGGPKVDIDEFIKLWQLKEQGSKVSYQIDINKKTVNDKSAGEALDFFLKYFWDYNEFRTIQKKIILNLLKGNNSLAVLPTGGGKSLIFQLGGLVSAVSVLVVAPLKSLLKDQVQNLKERGIGGVAYLDSSKTSLERQQLIQDFCDKKIWLLYIAPERLLNQKFFKLIQAQAPLLPLEMLIIDEAHCAVEWGYDFRPAYLQLTKIFKKLRTAKLLALTATASTSVQKWLMKQFDILEQNVFSGGALARNELNLAVVKVKKAAAKEKKLLEVLTKEIPSQLGYPDLFALHQEKAGLIFVPYAAPKSKFNQQRGTTAVQKLLNKAGIKAEIYHSQLSDYKRQQIQQQYLSGEIPLLVATKGFGLGIDKENIGYIIHLSYPNSLEAYYQEIGRAGRNRQRAHVVLIFQQRQVLCRLFYQKLPPCAYKLQCFFRGSTRCDYGIITSFIAGDNLDIAKISQKLKQFFTMIINGNLKGKTMSLTINKKDYLSYLLFLHYLQEVDIVDAVFVAFPPESFDKITLQLDLLDLTKLVKRRKALIKKIAKAIFYRQQLKIALVFKMRQYASNKKKCRRFLLVNYFQASIEEFICEACDVDGFNKK